MFAQRRGCFFNDYTDVACDMKAPKGSPTFCLDRFSSPMNFHYFSKSSILSRKGAMGLITF